MMCAAHLGRRASRPGVYRIFIDVKPIVMDIVNLATLNSVPVLMDPGPHIARVSH